MVRAFVLYDEAPEPERYAAHVELCKAVPGATFRHGKVFGPLRRASRSTRTTRSSSSPTANRSRRRGLARVRGDGEGRDGARRAVQRSLRDRWSMPEPDAPRPVAPDELGFERIVYTKEGSPGDDPAQPARGAERVRLPDAARDRPRVRGRVVGRRDPRRRGHRHGARVLRRRRPARRGAPTSSASRASTGSGSARSRTCTTGCARSASRRSRASRASRSAAATSCRWRAT